MIERVRCKGLLRSLTCLALLAPALFAQSLTTGDISGAVTDPSSAAVPNATVNLTNKATGASQTATTNAQGQYHFSLLPPGQYQVEVKTAGFSTSQKITQVQVGQATVVDVQLALSSASTTIEVSEAATLAQTDNANLATTFDAQQLNNLPAPGNDMTAYAFSAPGVSVSTGGGYGNFTVFGLPGVSNLFTINGTDNMDPYLNLNNSGASNLTLGSNEVQEAAVVMNGYTGQYGRQAGAQVNYVTKSGTNAFHGNAGWFYNGGIMNANDFFNNATATPRPFSVSNEWEDSLGGRIIKNKLFFFFDNEGLRYVLPSGGPIYIPSPSFASYVLNNLQTKNPAAVPFYTTAFNLYGNSSGSSRATPVNAGIDPALGCGDFTGGGFGTTQPCANVFRSTVNNLNTEWLLASKVDYNVTDKDRLYFRYNMDRGVQATGTDPINPAFNANSVQPQYGGQFGYTRVIGPTMVNQLLLSGSYYSALFGPPNINTALAAFPTTWAFTDGLYSSNNATGTSLGGQDQRYPAGRKVRQWQLIDDFSLTHGTNVIKFGVNVRRNFISTYAYGANTSGLLTFNSMTDFVNGSLDAGASTYTQAFANIGAEPLSLYTLGFYAQDEWKVKPNLTLTLTLRFDRNSNINCYASCFNELLNTFGQIAHSATTPYNTTIHMGLSNAFPSVEPIVPQPRIGFAWSVTPKTVIRGGVGFFTDLYQAVLADRLITNSPAVTTFTTTTGLVALNNPNSIFAKVGNSAAAFNSGFAGGATLAQLQATVPGFTKPAFNTIPNELYNPKFYEWNLEVQQSLTSKYLVSLNYVGNHGYDELSSTLFGNAYAPNGFQGLPTTVPDPRFGEIRELNNQSYSNYDGMVASFRWRTNANFSGQFSYTLGHALDTCSNACLEPFNLLTAPSIRYQINPLSLSSLNYGAADYDVRHTISANYIYTVPRHFHNGVLNQVLGGWTAAGTFLYHSGYPFSITDTSVRSGQISGASGIASAVVLADYLGGPGYPSCTTPNITCYSKSQFATPSAQHDWGNIPRNSFRGPGYFDTDINVNKTFTVKEKYQLLVGAYLFNVLNHANFDLPNNNIPAGNFGEIQSTVGPPTSAYGSFQGSAVSGRVIQTQIKFTF
ncbi:MAG TPA: carboxypeptidase regulatory-like domain-containing protein [Bryobacteraceae bacterium]|nr:carboxypeptidase regulatory-like domain-containing protein [Bryobacteraceae bacterium]